jgi:hypothetical protein
MSALGHFARLDQIDSDRDLSNEGKARKKKRLAAEAIADFQKSKSLRSAKNAVERMLEKRAEKTGLAVKPPANIAEAMIQCEIRAIRWKLTPGQFRTASLSS